VKSSAPALALRLDSFAYVRHAFDAVLSSPYHTNPLAWWPHFNKVFIMASAQYRIESRCPLMGSLLPPATFKQVYADCSLAVAVAVKSVADPTRQQVRVVHVPTGEIVFQTAPSGSAL
jgi:hypothetical protein